MLDLFSGLGGWSEPFRERGHEVVTVDNDPRFDCTYTMDVMDPAIFELPLFDPQIVLASPPCEKFSLMALGHHWLPGYKPRHEGTILAMELVKRTVDIIQVAAPAFYIVENPMGMLRALHLIPFERKSVTYCQYGARVRKETDLWGGFPPSLELRRRCKNGDPCHVAAPRGSRTGTQGPDDAATRAKIPYDLALDVCLAAERDLAAGLRAPNYSGRLFA